MPRYFFHLRDGDDVLLDLEGRDLSCLQAVAAVTLEEARAIIAHDARDGEIRLTYRLAVEDETGRPVHRLDFEDAIAMVRPIPAR
jgi:hypothetical protein